MRGVPDLADGGYSPFPGNRFRPQAGKCSFSRQRKVTDWSTLQAMLFFPSGHLSEAAVDKTNLSLSSAGTTQGDLVDHAQQDLSSLYAGGCSGYCYFLLSFLLALSGNPGVPRKQKGRHIRSGNAANVASCTGARSLADGSAEEIYLSWPLVMIDRLNIKLHSLRGSQEF